MPYSNISLAASSSSSLRSHSNPNNNILSNANSNLDKFDSNMTNMSTSASSSDYNNLSNATTTICRVIALDDEDSRECPSQGASELAREDIYHLGTDFRGDVNHNTKHVLYTMYDNSGALGRNSSVGTFGRSEGLSRCSSSLNASFTERRDSNSFDHDGDSDDESVTDRRTSYSGKPGTFTTAATTTATTFTTNTNNGEFPLQHLAMRIALVESARRVSLAASTTIHPLLMHDTKNKRKTPSPVMGVEPAPVSIEPLCDHYSDNHDDNDAMHVDQEASSRGYESAVKTATTANHVMLPSPGRRVSLSPVSRRLALQFDSISFYSPIRPSTKRRKTLDTSAVC